MKTSPHTHRTGQNQPSTTFISHQLLTTNFQGFHVLPFTRLHPHLVRGYAHAEQNTASSLAGTPVLASTGRGMGVVRSTVGLCKAPSRCAWAQSCPYTGSALPLTRTRPWQEPACVRVRQTGEKFVVLALAQQAKGTSADV